MRLKVLSDPPRVGIIACLPPHVLTKSAMEQTLTTEDMALDLGLTEEEARTIPLGTPVVYDTVPTSLGEGRFSGKGLDNRASIAALLLALDRLPDKLDIDLVILLSTQKELGLRGAQTGFFALEPDMALCLDVTFGHTPDTKPEEALPLGGGAAIGAGPLLCRTLTQRLQTLAEAEGIFHQLEILPGKTSTTADRAGVSRTGVPTALISLPIRYMHSPTELVDLADIEAVASLIVAFLKDEGGGVDA